MVFLVKINSNKAHRSGPYCYDIPVSEIYLFYTYVAPTLNPYKPNKATYYDTLKFMEKTISIFYYLLRNNFYPTSVF